MPCRKWKRKSFDCLAQATVRRRSRLGGLSSSSLPRPRRACCRTNQESWSSSSFLPAIAPRFTLRGRYRLTTWIDGFGTLPIAFGPAVPPQTKPFITFEVSLRRGIYSESLADWTRRSWVMCRYCRRLKQARTAAKEAGRLGVFLGTALSGGHPSRKAGKTRSEIGYGAASVGSALASMLRRRSKSGSFRILLIGAGNAARNIGLHLAKSELGSIVCINRTRHKANELARRLGGESRPWDELEAALLESDLVIAATSAAEPVLQKNDLEELAQRRRGEPILIVDAGLPRNVEPGSPLDVIGIDEVRELQEQVLARRRASVPSVERIIQDAVEEWGRWLASRPIEEIVRSLFQELPHYTKQAAARLVDGGVLTSEKAEQILAKSLRELLHDHVRRLRTLSSDGDIRVMN